MAKALEIIAYFERLNPPLLWFMENGHTTLLWGREVARDLTAFVLLDYASTGDTSESVPGLLIPRHYIGDRFWGSLGHW